jgi:hypothetical protein
MSDHLTTVPTEQSQPQAAPDPQAVEEGPEQAVAQAVQDATQQAEEAEAQAREQADATLKAASKAYRKGEQAYRQGLFESGRLGDLYLSQRMTLGDKRAAAVQTLEGELSKWSSAPVDANVLIRVYHAHRLLCDEPGVKAPDVPYGHYRDSYCQLVQRVDRDTPAERWVLLPGMEAESLALFARCVKDKLSRDAIQDGVKALLREHVAKEAAAAREQAAKAAEEAKARADAERATREAAEAAEREAHAATRAAAEAQATEDKARLTAEADKTKAELLARQQEAAKATEERAQADAAKARAETNARTAQDAADKAADKATRAAERQAARQARKDGKADDGKPVQRETVAPNLLKSVGKQGTAKDIAGMAAELITSGDFPDDTLHELLNLLKASPELSAKAGRAIDAALLVLARSDRTNPVNIVRQTMPAAVPSTNGHVAAVA